jgi:hypothetical protein
MRLRGMRILLHRGYFREEETEMVSGDPEGSQGASW